VSARVLACEIFGGKDDFGSKNPKTSKKTNNNNIVLSRWYAIA